MLYSLPLVRESRTVLNSGFHAVDFRFQLLDSEFFVSGSRIPDSTLVGFQIPHSYSCILNSKAQDSGFYKLKFLRFWNPERNPDSLTQGKHFVK